jgi:hypothetical protein
MRCFFFILSFLSIFSAFCQSYTYGRYEGDGGATQAISGLGFQPDFILIKSSINRAAVFHTSSMPAGEAKLGTGTAALATGYISSIDADGFTVGTANEVNNLSEDYFFIAWDDDSDIAIGSYSGDGTTGGSNSVNVGFRPSYIWIFGDRGVWPDYTGLGIDGMAGTVPNGFAPGWVSAMNVFDAFTATGWNVGDDVNNSGTTYYYVAFNPTVNSTKTTYSGDESSDYHVNIGIQPDFVIAKSNLQEAAYFKIASMGGDTSYRFDANGRFTDRIKTFEATGFDIGDNAEVNSTGKTINAFYSRGGGLLPVDLLSFDAKPQLDGSVRIEWATASEINSDLFYIQHSEDGENFETIGTVAGAGNSSTRIDYEFYHTNPNSGNNYYRLQQVDFDGKYEFFKTVLLNMTTGLSLTQVNVFPNPVRDRLFVTFEGSSDDSYVFEVIDQFGRVVEQSTVMGADGENKIGVDVILLQSGYYVGRLSNQETVLDNIKFYKD